MPGELPRRTEPSLEGTAVIGFEDGEGDPKEFALGDDDEVESRRDVIVTENLSYQSFSAISYHRAAELLCHRHAQPPHRTAVGLQKKRAIAAVEFRAGLVDVLKLRMAPNPLVLAERQPYSLLTVSRFRPLARRRFRTRRPFLLLILTRNPCARFRWRVFG
jgi:hypothetical protein